MSNNDEDTKAVVKQKSNFSVIWILPFIAALIGIGMVYHHIQNQGIEITIVFEDAEGLEANKTKVKYRNVDIGTVKTINFNEDGTSIEALVEIDRKPNSFCIATVSFG